MTANSSDLSGDDRLPDPIAPDRADRLKLARKYQQQGFTEENPLAANLTVLLGDLFACTHVAGESAQAAVSRTGEAEVLIEPRAETLRKYVRDVTRTVTCIERIKQAKEN